MRWVLPVWIVGVFIHSLVYAGPKYGPNASPLSRGENASYFRENSARDFFALIPYYVPQPTGWTCSAANIAMILNAARSKMELSSTDKLVTVDSLIKEYSNSRYKKSMSGRAAFMADRGVVANSHLADVLRAGFAKLGMKPESYQVDLRNIDPKDKEKSRREFFSALEENEKSANDFILFSFMQGALTGDPEGGAHVATVAAYDSKTKKVLVLDSDREWYEPYWSPRDALFDSIADPKSDSERPGWIHIRIR